MTKTDIGKRIGTRLRALRDAAHLTQPDLAERVGPHGIETETVSHYERGMRVPTLPMLSDLAAALGTDLDTLLAGVINAEPVDRAELKKIVALLEPLSDEHLRVIRVMIAAHLEGVGVAAKPVAAAASRKGGGEARDRPGLLPLQHPLLQSATRLIVVQPRQSRRDRQRVP